MGKGHQIELQHRKKSISEVTDEPSPHSSGSRDTQHGPPPKLDGEQRDILNRHFENSPSRTGQQRRDGIYQNPFARNAEHQPSEASESGSPVIKILHGDNEDSLDEQDDDNQRSISELKSIRLQNSIHKNKFPNSSKQMNDHTGKKLLFSQRTTLMLEESQKFDEFGRLKSKTAAARSDELLSLSPTQKDLAKLLYPGRPELPKDIFVTEQDSSRDSG